MKMDKIDDHTVKVVLSCNDMFELSINYDDMDYENPVTKKAILKIIERINAKFNLCLISRKLFIEAYPYADGGCILFVNMIESAAKDGILQATTAPVKNAKTQESNAPSIYALSDLNVLGKLSRKLNSAFTHEILDSALCYCAVKKEYYLLVSTRSKASVKLDHLLCEYGRFCGKGAVSQAIFLEHTKVLMKEDAAQILARCL